MEATTKRTAAAFAALDALYWAGNASGMGFLTAYFLKCGLGSGILSLVIAIFQALSLAGGVFWGNLCDRRGTNRRIFLPVFPACQGILLLIYYFASRNMTLACLLYFAAGFLISSMGTNLDVWIMRSVRYDPASFGVIRGIGSIGYAVSMLATGFLVESFGYSVIVTASYLFAIPTMMLAVLLKEPVFLRNNTRKVSASALLGNRPYIYLVIVILLSGMAVNPVSSLQPVLLESVGGSVSVLGIDMFAAVMFQGLFIMLSGKLARFSPHMLWNHDADDAGAGDKICTGGPSEHGTQPDGHDLRQPVRDFVSFLLKPAHSQIWNPLDRCGRTGASRCSARDVHSEKQLPVRRQLAPEYGENVCGTILACGRNA